MTPLIRSMVSRTVRAGVDPTQMHWFDATGGITNQTDVSLDPLLTTRPPFEKCMVCWEGHAASNGKRMEFHLLITGRHPEEGILLGAWRMPENGPLVGSPTMVYLVEDGLVEYGPLAENDAMDEKEGEMIMGFLSAWLGSLSRRAESYIPSVKPTFTNRRKIAAGKPPLYEWRTVVIEPVQARREHQGGTHASPRLHDRRGHLRRLRSGKNVWVRECKVGNASKGVVFHDYQIKEMA